MRQNAIRSLSRNTLQEQITRTIALSLVVLGALMSVTAQKPPVENPPAVENQGAGNSAYRLGPGDVIRITVLRQDLLTQDGVRIGNDGKIRLQMLDEPLRAACMTEAELAATIAERYRKYILNPHVLVSTREFNSSSVAVIGAVNSPGRFQLQRTVRLLEMLTFVNGPTATASTELQILRTSDGDVCVDGNPVVADGAAGEGKPEILSLKINDVLMGAVDANPVLRGGDVISIAQAEQRQAYLLGNVRAATTINLKDPVGLSTAIAMAGGATSGAQLDKIKITRQIPGTANKSDMFVNLKEIQAGSRPDVMLEPNDIVDVPGPSGTKKLFKDILRTVVPVITRVPVIIP